MHKTIIALALVAMCAPQIANAQSTGTMEVPRTGTDGYRGEMSTMRYLLDPKVISVRLTGVNMDSSTIRDMAMDAIQQAGNQAGVTIVPEDTGANDRYIDKVAASGRYNTSVSDTPVRGQYLPGNYRFKSITITGGRNVDNRFRNLDQADLPVTADLSQEQVTLHLVAVVERITTAANSYTIKADASQHHLQAKHFRLRANKGIRIGGRNFGFDTVAQIAGLEDDQQSSSNADTSLMQNDFLKLSDQIASQLRSGD